MKIFTVRILIFCLPVIFLSGELFLAREMNGVCERVVDGDTIVVSKHKIRLDFIDAPESSQKSSEGIEIGLESKHYLEALILHKLIHIDIRGIDKYGRYIGTVFLGDEDINLKMVRDGYALLYKFAVFVTKIDKYRFVVSILEAKRKKLGIWRVKSFENPYRFRKLAMDERQVRK